MKQPVERRLAAILAADVAGYSRLMGADEEGTHERLTAHLRELVDPKIKEHRGRTVKNPGDGMPIASRILGRAKGPHLVRSHLFRRSAQGRDAGGMTTCRPIAGDDALGETVTRCGADQPNLRARLERTGKRAERSCQKCDAHQGNHLGLQRLEPGRLVVMALTLALSRSGQTGKAASIALMCAGTALVFFGLYVGSEVR
jgi:class 3 adenylate cyclase